MTPDNTFTATCYSIRKPTPDNPLMIVWWRDKRDPKFQRTTGGDEFPVVKGELYAVVFDDTGGGRHRHLSIKPAVEDQSAPLPMAGNPAVEDAKTRARDLRAKAAALLAEATKLDGGIPDNGELAETPTNAANSFLLFTSEQVKAEFIRFCGEHGIDPRAVPELTRAAWAIEAADCICGSASKPDTKEAAFAAIAGFAESETEIKNAIARGAMKLGVIAPKEVA